MLARRLTTLLAVFALALALPAVASAQSAGDDQYQDPFGGGGGTEQTGGGGGGSTGGGGGGSTGGGGGGSYDSGSGTYDSGTGGEVVVDDPATEVVEGPTAEQAAATGSGGLARTGSETWIIAIAGFGLLALGAGLFLRFAPSR
jgi:LPXTG-motif cell wall-anchored protein